jgi:ATP/maltotriose-dependent transcriptional regulator MalT
MRALLRQYDGDLDGALADLREARTKAREFGSLSINDEIFIDMRWIDLYMRQGDHEQALVMIDQARERALRFPSPELQILVNALEATTRIHLGDLGHARELIEQAEADMAREVPFGGAHGGALLQSGRALLSVKLGDAAGAEAALARAYTAGLESRDMPIMSLVAVAAAALADYRGRHRDVAFLLGVASRLRGTHDRSDPRIREMIGRGRVVLGEDAVTEAYQLGWELDTKAASAQIDPAQRLSIEGGQARRA